LAKSDGWALASVGEIGGRVKSALSILICRPGGFRVARRMAEYALKK